MTEEADAREKARESYALRRRLNTSLQYQARGSEVVTLDYEQGYVDGDAAGAADREQAVEAEKQHCLEVMDGMVHAHNNLMRQERAAVAAEERARIVAWLRRSDATGGSAPWAADMLEADAALATDATICDE